MDKKSRWQKIIEDQKRSGLSIKRYCSERKISYHSFNYWSTRLRTSPPATKNFLPVKVRNLSEGFTIKLSSVQMTFTSEPNPTWFAKVLKEMGHEECR